MKRFIDVHADEVMAGCGEVILKSEAHGACLVIAAYDSAHKIGALAHAMFAAGASEKEKGMPMILDADKAIDEMIDDMTLLGSGRDDIEVCLVTGENVPHQENDPDYNRSLHRAIDLLKEKHIKVKNDTIKDAGSSHVLLDVDSGRIVYVEDKDALKRSEFSKHL